MPKIILYHGSRDVIETPIYGQDNRFNDYGLGFYCTEHLDLAKEWSSSELLGGYANKYELQTDDLKILNLSSPEFSILNWLAILLANRRVALSNPITNKGQEYLISNFCPDIDEFDLLIGYRADDSYFSFARAFLNNTIPVKQLAHSMNLGSLGEQYVLKTKKAFSSMHFVEYEKAEHPFYFILRQIRDMEARENYIAGLQDNDIDGLYLKDIIKEGIKNDDPRLF